MGCILTPLRGFSRSLAAYPRLTPWAGFLRRFATSFAPLRRTHGLRRGLHSYAAPTAYAVGCILTPLRDFFRSLAAHPRLTPWAAFLRRFATSFAPLRRTHGL
ncbi:MAG TPA: hypothetical protein VK555_07950 [Terriglobales bacterium]|nr:hypothetical protein [Terriglobales bacterium]